MLSALPYIPTGVKENVYFVVTSSGTTAAHGHITTEQRVSIWLIRVPRWDNRKTELTVRDAEWTVSG